MSLLHWEDSYWQRIRRGLQWVSAYDAWVHDVSGDVLRVEEGALYPALSH
jgi:hypothetical protein